MSCCKSKSGYEFSLVLNEHSNIIMIEQAFHRNFNWPPSKIDAIIEIAKETGKCKLFDVGQDEMVRLSKKLSKNNIPYSVTQVKIHK